MSAKRLSGWCRGVAALAAGLGWVGMASQALAEAAPQDQARAQALAGQLAQELARICPVAAPQDQAAFDACRGQLYQSSLLRGKLPDFILWGRQRDPARSLKETGLTQFAPDVITGMYLPLFMFSGQQRVLWVEKEKLFQLRMQTAFRNRLAPGQFPYPFWHEADKWSTYENAAELIFWWNPQRDRITVAQFTAKTEVQPAQPPQPVAMPKFDGQWMWTDAAGQTQPKATLFDGILRADNPYVTQVDAAYRKLALRMRDGQCDQCHIPNNPDGMKRLVLLQTPAHAAGEISRLLKSVREDRMPRDDAGIEAPLAGHAKAVLLEEGQAFERVLQLAKGWEAQRRASPVAGSPAVRSTP